jgi:protein-disulfide isomerase
MRNVFFIVFLGAIVITPQAFAKKSQTVKRLEVLEGKMEAMEKRLKALERGKPTRPTKPPQIAAYDIPTGRSPFLGTAKAPIQVVVFADFECPFCARVFPMLLDLQKDSSLRGQVQIVHKHFPLSFHKQARPAAKAAMAAQEQGDEYFWLMAEKLYENTKELNDDNFITWAAEIGLNVERFQYDLSRFDERYERQLNEDMKLGQTAASVRGTPSIFVNGWELKTRSVQGVKDLANEKLSRNGASEDGCSN